MTEAFLIADNIFSPIGRTTGENFDYLKTGCSGIKQYQDTALSNTPFHAALFDNKDDVAEAAGDAYTKFERILISSVSNALASCPSIDINDKRTLLAICSTKGNIGLLETEKDSPQLRNRIALHHSAKLIADYFHFENKPVAISCACISGLLGVITAMRLLRSRRYETIVVTGADTISRFVLSGFQSFQAISRRICKPFDRDRDGINLGEAAATIVLSSNPKHNTGIKIRGGATSNDANHISGPSRTGAELCMAISRSLADANARADDIDLISAHGTATLFNDEMEANAFTLAGLRSVPVNSLKGYYGHTLGAAGLVESVITMQSMKESIAIPTYGFQQIGVTAPINVCDTLLSMPLNNCLKTASGFGGCNAAAVFSKT